ncbi:MAG TPA: sigma-54 dependent transcriptional regulator [Bacteroidota bacterium]|nr:sigma-54 dependent transcriptional regulator [Bacteroidota bacterium]
MGTILVIDDEKSIRDSIRMILEYEKYNVLFAETGSRGLAVFKDHAPDAVLLDIKMPGGRDGMEILKEIRELSAETPVIMISGHGTIDTAVEATKLGAFDFLPKPLDREKLLITVRNALDHRRLAREVQQLRGKDRIVTASEKMKEILALVRRIGPTEARILITGESGTGKEVIARAVHRASRRAAGPFIEVNCAAIPAELIESELFGHEKGSFTGATAQRTGKFEQATTGTIFLDEIGDMSLQAQAKVLRILEEGKVERVGGERFIEVDVRVIAATNKDLNDQIGKGQFREDLFHRLNVIPIHVPPLRERRDDIPPLIDAFVEDVCARNGLPLRVIAPEAVDALTRMEWRGNVRELRNAVERLVIVAPGKRIEPEDVESLSFRRGGAIEDLIASGLSFQDFKDRAEALFIAHQLKLQGWNVSRTAEVLGMERSHLYTKIKKYGLGRDEKKEQSTEEDSN